MSWFSQLLTRALPFVADVFETRDLKQSGDKLFTGLAKSLKDAATDPDKIREIAGALEEKAGELTGAIVARTPASVLMDPAFMPPGSVAPNPDVVPVPTGPAEPIEPVSTEPLPMTNPPGGDINEDEYEYDDSDDDEDEDEGPADEQDDKPKPKKPATKKKKK